MTQNLTDLLLVGSESTMTEGGHVEGCQWCWPYTDDLRLIMDEADRRGVREVHITENHFTWIVKPPSGPTIRRVNTSLFVGAAGVALTAQQVVADAMPAAEAVMSALRGADHEVFHFEAPVSPDLLGRRMLGLRRERVAEGFETRVDVSVTFKPFLLVSIGRPSSVAVGPLTRSAPRGRPPRSVMRAHLAAARAK